MTDTADVVVVGGGVIGLTSAVRLAEAGLRVRVRTAAPVEETTSAAAGAMCGPVITGPEDPATRWATLSAGRFAELAAQDGTGVTLTRGRLVSEMAGTPPWAAAVPSFRPCAPAEHEPFASGFWAELPLADMSRYLPYLLARLRRAGAEVRRQPVAALADALADAPTVVNCTGLAARELAGDDTVTPVKGQHVVVANPGVDEFLYQGGATDEWVGWFPHGDRVVLGGVAVPGDESTEPDAAVAERIRRRCAELEPRFAGAEVLAHQVGLRPVRPAVRLEAEPLGDGRVVHNYGHGPVGVTLSWGCAEDVLALVDRRPLS